MASANDVLYPVSPAVSDTTGACVPVDGDYLFR
jgi:hypothetical protein